MGEAMPGSRPELHASTDGSSGEQVRFGLFQRGKTTSVDGAWAEARDGGEMFRSGVTLVLGKSIARVGLFGFEHPTVAGDLGEDGRGCDGVAEGVSLDDGGLPPTQGRHRVAVDEGMGGFRGDTFERLVHPLVRGGEDVDAVDDVGIDRDDGEAEVGVSGDQVEITGARIGGELLGIVELEEIRWDARFPPLGREDDRGNEDGTCERAAAGLIDTGHGVDSAVPELAFVVETVCRGW